MTDSVDGVTEYTYDAQGQLTEERVTPVDSTQAPRTMSMRHDNYGNILSKTTNDVTKTYEYNCTWKDKLTAVDGVPIVYDNLGNPISYLGHNLTWEKGRQLKSFDSNTYTYNANGIRTSKTVGGVKHTYFLDGAKILKETWGDCTLIPLYDNEDSVCGIMYDDAAYYFHKNLQGDVIGIKNAYGVLVARYTYDAWGQVIAVTDEDGFDVSDNAAHVANANPFRYRGYYYDTEIGMYYLQSRYYDPVVGRFINGDEVKTVSSEGLTSVGYNIFAYCQNTPVNGSDIYGHAFIQVVAKIILGVLLGFIIQYVFDILDYLVRLIINKTAGFSVSARDYLLSIASCILAFFDIRKRWVRWAIGLGKIVIANIERNISDIKWFNVFADIFFFLIGEIVGGALNRKQTTKLKKATDRIRQNKKKLAERLVNAKIDNTRNNIKANFEALGVGITFAIDITNKMVNMVADYFISDS